MALQDSIGNPIGKHHSSPVHKAGQSAR